MAKYFTIIELTRSREAEECWIDNTPSEDVIRRLNDLTNNLLDHIRELWGAPIRVNSGYRSPILNKVIGGTPNSQHIRGEAADITTGSREDNRRLFDMIREAAEAGELEFDQLIDERNYSWLHISYRAGGERDGHAGVNRRQDERHRACPHVRGAKEENERSDVNRRQILHL